MRSLPDKTHAQIAKLLTRTVRTEVPGVRIRLATPADAAVLAELLPDDGTGEVLTQADWLGILSFRHHQAGFRAALTRNRRGVVSDAVESVLVAEAGRPPMELLDCVDRALTTVLLAVDGKTPVAAMQISPGLQSAEDLIVTPDAMSDEIDRMVTHLGIDALTVVPEARRRGIGSALVATARTLGIAAGYATVLATGTAANGDFARATGFRWMDTEGAGTRSAHDTGSAHDTEAPCLFYDVLLTGEERESLFAQIERTLAPTEDAAEAPSPTATDTESTPAGSDTAIDTTIDPDELAGIRYFLRAAREPLALTAAGWLKPAHVQDIAAHIPTDIAAGGKNNRENTTPGVRDTRVRLQEAGLLAVEGSTVVLTAAGEAALADEPALITALG
ncbi:GNAT family N-acetyltransferase [Brevibacterium litoralis]|uniref:GNAT family N-acetyltransferase n=1 Tax=Brevibacterium litoralis TaxID=3138935 RepID=UPI0032EB9957